VIPPDANAALVAAMEDVLESRVIPSGPWFVSMKPRNSWSSRRASRSPASRGDRFSPWDHEPVLARISRDADVLLGGKPTSALIIDESSFQ
jgi:hypothetical protein